MRSKIRNILREAKTYIGDVDGFLRFAITNRIPQQTYQIGLSGVGFDPNSKLSDELISRVNNLTNVYKLKLSDCDLHEFPKAFLSFTNISDIDISYNPISNIDDVLGINGLNSLTAHKTLINKIPPAILDTGIRFLALGLERIDDVVYDFIKRGRSLMVDKTKLIFDDPTKMYYFGYSDAFAVLYCYNDMCFEIYHSGHSNDFVGLKANDNASVFALNRMTSNLNPKNKSMRSLIDIFGDEHMTINYMSLLTSNNDESIKLANEILKAHL